MTTQIFESRYKDQPALTVESGEIAAQFLPHIGAKLCSLWVKRPGLELLVQRPGSVYRLAPYGGDYVGQGECSGFDDMFPTIDRCFYDRYPWQGTEIPDHGEVWSIPWTAAVEGDRLHLAVDGIRFPYRLEKWISFAGDARLHIDYRLTNRAPFDFAFLWAAHPMFVLEEGAELTLPAGVAKVVTTLSFSGRLGGYGTEFSWPLATLADGSQRDLRKIQPKSAQDAGKYYVSGRLPEGWCELSYPRSGVTVRLEFPVERVPYLGVLPNEGGWQDLYNIFLEPATAPLDRPDVARLHGQQSTVRAGATYDWYLDIQVA